MPIPNPSIEIMKLGIRRTPNTNSKNPTWKVTVYRLGLSLTINDIPNTRRHGNAASHSSPIVTLYINPFIYCSCHAKACLYPTQPYKYIIECIYKLYNITILVQVYMKYIEIQLFQPGPQHKHFKNLAPKEKTNRILPGI